MNERARVPFALVGVLLLVGSATYAASMERPVATSPQVSERMEALSAETNAAVREAAREAARRAGAAPVIEPANTTVGRALDGDSAFRDALRLRIYTRTRRALSGLERTNGDLHVRARLPAPAETDVREAIRRVRVEPAGPRGARLRVTVENVTLTVRRDGRIVGRKRVTPTVTVTVPVLAVHERVRRFERQLNAGPLDGGLGRRLTAALYPIAWARGYAQYGGTPIENVIANRHVALATNGAVLDLQRATFGASDPVGRQALRTATAETALTDLLTGAGEPSWKRLERARQRAMDTSPLPDSRLAEQARTGSPSPTDDVTIGVNTTADRAFLQTLDRLDGILRATYTATVRRRVAVEALESRQIERQSTPEANWTLLRTRSDVSVSVTTRDADRPTPAGEGHLLAHYPRSVTRTQTVTRAWSTPAGTETTQTRRVSRFHVSIALVGRHDGGPAPVVPVAGIHTPGGPLDGPNLADIRPGAHRRLVADAGGADRIARDAVTGEVGDASRRIVGDRPPGLRAWVYADLADFRREVANVSITTSRANVSTFGVNPAARLRAELRDRRRALIDRPAQYEGVADRARVAARVAYLERVSAMLKARAEARRERAQAVADRLPGNSTDRLHAAYRNRSATAATTEPSVPMTVDARPAYLTVGELGPEALPSVRTAGHPLAVRNVNLVGVPYADAAGPVVDAFLGSKRIPLRTAAAVLGAAGATERAGVVEPSRRRLEGQVDASVDRLERRAETVLAEAGLGPAADRRAVIERGLAGWQRPSARALALANGSGTDAIRAAAAREWALTANEEDELGLRLDRAVRRALGTEAVRVDEPVVNSTAADLRAALRSKVRRTAEDATERAATRVGERIRDGVVGRFGERAGRLLAALPAGVPVAPVPGLWYATINLWSVEVRGTYAQFIVRVPRGTSDTVGGFRYVRDGDTVQLDVDGDGDRERLGRATRVTFATGTEVAVGVPPGPQGVGDVDGNRDETSPGWPTPGWK